MLIKEALVKVGILPEDTEFSIAISKYLNAGGTIERARSLLDAAAERMPEGDQTVFVRNDHTDRVHLRQPVEDARGQTGNAVKGLGSLASPSSSNRGGDGLVRHANHLDIAGPVREPKPQRAAIDFGAASVAIKTKLAQSVLDRAKTSDGRSWGDVGAHELDGMSRDGALAKALKDHLGMLSNEQRFKKIRDLVNPETFEAIRSAAHGA
jgi:hypothetical protein